MTEHQNPDKCEPRDKIEDQPGRVHGAGFLPREVPAVEFVTLAQVLKRGAGWLL